MKKLIPIFCDLCLAFAFQATAPAQIITNEPQSITINSASTATFTVGASSATNYQWQFNGSNLTDIGNITGSTKSVLTLEDVTTNEAGSYTVVLNGSVQSSNAVLTIVPGTIVRFIFTNFPSGGTSNMDVQLFNHDKPVTVQNFIHYITAGAYTNMFFDRCLPGFVLQGGDYGASNQTMDISPITGWIIEQQFTQNGAIEPPFPAQITNEFHVGPLIHNHFATIAMAHPTNGPNTASSAFFFNLTNNSPYLDTTNGGFAVFGRVIDGTNVLQYFNTLTNCGGMVTNGEIVFDGGLMTNSLTNLPVNYIGTNAPANLNLAYCSFQIISPPGDTNLPTISITSPTTNALWSNSVPLTIRGTAIDTNDIGLAWVRCDLIPLPAADGTLPNGGVSLTNYVLGATNWTLDFGIVAPGMYKLGAQVQDEATNLSTEEFVQPVTITAVVTNGNGSVTFTNGAYTNLNAVGYPFQNGSNYNLVATPGTNQVFVSWTAGNQTDVNQEISGTNLDRVLLTATFISNGLPNSMAFTYPASNAVISTNAFDITGTISNVASTPVTVICHIYSSTSLLAFSPPLTNSGVTNNWSVAVSGLLPGQYSVEAMAADSASNSTVIVENFSVATNAPLQLNIVGPGTVSPVTNGETFPVGSTFQVTASANPGQLFYSWSNSASTEVSMNPVQTYTMAAGLKLTATFVTNNFPNMIAFTYPPANGIAGTNTLYITGTISSNVLSTPVTVTCQIFSQTTLLAASQLLKTSGTTTWSIGLNGLGVGSYTLVATASDLAGDSTLISEDFSVQYSGALQLIIVGKGTVSPVTNGEMLPLGANFEVTATPASGQVFYTWNNGTQISTNATQTYTMAYGLTLTATFIPSNTAKGISFTYPAANARLSTNTFPLKGRIAASFKPAGITCQVFQTNGLAIGPPLMTSGTSTWAVPVTNLPGGYYTVEAVATNPVGMSTIISENFSVLPFAAVAGTYSGLFISTNSPVAPTNSGFLTFTVEPTGLFSGKVVFPAYAPIPIFPTFFENIGFTAGYFPFGIKNFHGNTLSGAIYLDLNSGTDVALGTISSDAWSSQLICHRAVTKLSTNTTPATGKYILSLQPGNQTNRLSTNGYAALVIAKGGTVALSGALPDNTTFSQSARVSKDGIWPLYVIPTGYKTNGMLMGWETNLASGGSSGQLYWYKAPNAGAYYTSGVDTNVISTGTNYLPPAATNYSIVFQGGTIVPPLTNFLKVNEADEFFVSGGSADKLKISLSANGVISGSVLNTNDNKTLRFKGAFIGPSQGGSGFIPDAGGQTGCFELELEAP